MNRFFIFVALLVFFQLSANAQKNSPQANTNRDLVQFSGVVVEGDSLRPVPYTSIIVRRSSTARAAARCRCPRRSCRCACPTTSSGGRRARARSS
ncbi:MAG TPA: hypothetical protein VLB84_20460, partial [Bacteroidia bacterium]|nr:hypothetical protein [Bacteroidia bacterium]